MAKAAGQNSCVQLFPEAAKPPNARIDREHDGLLKEVDYGCNSRSRIPPTAKQLHTAALTFFFDRLKSTS